MAKKFKQKPAAKAAPKSKTAKAPAKKGAAKAGKKPGPGKPASKPASKPAVKAAAKTPSKAGKAAAAARKPAKPAPKGAAGKKGPKAPAKASKPGRRSAPKPVEELLESPDQATLAVEEWSEEVVEVSEAPAPDEAFETAPEDSGVEPSGVGAEPAPAGPIVPLTAAEFAVEAARLLLDDKCTDVVVLDVAKLTSVSRYIVIGTGTSDRQMRSVLEDVAELGRRSGHAVARRSVDERATWVLADFVDVVVHLFEPNTRAYYDLEMMWGDAPRVAWERPAGETPKIRNRRIIAE